VPEFTDKDEETAFYNHDSNRAVGVVWAAIVENRLTDALMAGLRKDKEIQKDLFGPQGPLTNFGTKIRLAYMLGMINLDMKNDLLCISRIRNAFAHSVKIKDFDSPPVCDYMSQLKVIKAYTELLNTKKEELKRSERSKRKKPEPVTGKMKLSEKGFIFILEQELFDNRSKYHCCVRNYISILTNLEKGLKDAARMYFEPSAQGSPATSPKKS
jgi:hypothetical protein